MWLVRWSTTAIHLIEHMIYCFIVKPRGVGARSEQKWQKLAGQFSLVGIFPVSFVKSRIDQLTCNYNEKKRLVESVWTLDLLKDLCQKKQLYFFYSRTALPCIVLALYFSLIPLSIDGSCNATHFQNSMVNSPSVCVDCSGSRAQFRTMLPCSSHITVLSYKTSWWHGFSQGQTLSIS